jgi:hypothetical protein
MRGLQSRSISAKAVVMLLAFMASIAPSYAKTDDPIAVPTVKALWQFYELDFHYMGMTTYYSCDGLRDRMKEILLSLGAREDSLVWVAACDRTPGPALMPSVHIVAAFPVESTNELVAAQKMDTKRAELLSQMQERAKNKKVFTDEPFDAASKHVVLSTDDGSSSHRFAGDCELLEQLAKRLLPTIGAKIVSDQLFCMPHATTVSSKLVVESLVATKATN